MDKKILAGFLVIFVVLSFLAIVHFLSSEDNWICVDGQWVKRGNPSTERPGEDCSNLKNIIIESPEADQVVGKNLVIKGKARVFENQFNWVILDAYTQKEILAGNAYANSEDVGLFGPFEINVNLADVITDKIIVQVFDYSAKDGVRQDVDEIQLKFNRRLKDYYEVYFSNSKLDLEESCLKVFPILRSAGNEEPSLIKNIEILLLGPSEKDKEAGYYTSIPDGVKVNFIKKDGISMKVDFSKDIEDGMGGSCRVASVRAQIVKTVLAFDESIRSVIISVEGETEMALQP
jgi:hypothetical protein